MEKPKAISAREFVDKLPYVGECYQPSDEVYTKKEMDKYLESLKKYWKKRKVATIESA